MRDCNHLGQNFRDVFFVLVGYDLPQFEVKLEMLYSLKITNKKIFLVKQVNLSEIPEFDQTCIDFEIQEELKLRFVNKKGVFDFDFVNSSIKYATKFSKSLKRVPDSFEI